MAITWDTKVVEVYGNDTHYRVTGIVDAHDAEPTEWYAEKAVVTDTVYYTDYESIEYTEQGFSKRYHTMEEAIKVCEDHEELSSTTEDGEAFFDIEDEP